MWRMDSVGCQQSSTSRCDESTRRRGSHTRKKNYPRELTLTVKRVTRLTHISQQKQQYSSDPAEAA